MHVSGLSAPQCSLRGMRLQPKASGKFSALWQEAKRASRAVASRLRTALVLTLGLALALPLALGGEAESATPARAITGDILGFGSNLEPFIQADTNGGIFADGAISNIITCLPGGTNDFIFPVSDIFIVESGSAAPFAKLSMADGTSPATIIGAGSTGAFIAELIAVTGPQGALGEGVYDVVFDNCQDGKYTPTEDTVFQKVITVKYSARIPVYNQWIGNLKGQAYKSAAIWATTNRFMVGLTRMSKGEPPANWDDVEAEMPGVRLPLIDDIVAWWEETKSSLTPAAGPGGLFAIAKDLAVNQGKHYNAIAEDPPDQNYKHSTVVQAFEVPLSDSEIEPFALVQALGSSAASEGALSAALLRSLERYQGASVSNDPGWALTHARELEDLALTLADVNLQTADELDALLGSLEQLPEWDRIGQELQQFLGHVSWQNWSPEELQTMANLGMSSDDRVALAARMREESWAYSKDYWSMDRVRTHLTAHAGQQRAMAAELTLMAENLREAQTDLESQAAVPDDLPSAKAGGPYSVTAGESLQLDGSRSAAGEGRGLSEYAWDADGDGKFDDAFGASASVTMMSNAPNLVGLRVTDDTGRAAVSYAPVAVERGGPPAIGGVPETLTVVATVGEEFTLTPDLAAGGSSQWLLDEQPTSGRATFALTPAPDQVGVHTLELRVEDELGRTARRDWYLVVVEADVDGDGWTASGDCVDDDARINPGQSEVIGNRTDDDCDPGTPDLPLGSMPGRPVSWGSGDRVDTYGLGRQINDAQPGELPSAIAGLDHSVLRIEGGDRMGLALTENGGLWAWGWGSGGQLGTGNNTQRATATAVVGLSGTGQLGLDGPGVADFDSNRISVAVLKNGSAAAWGPNADGVLGIGSTSSAVNIPRLLQGPSGDLSAVIGAVSADAFLAFNVDGELWVTAGACGTDEALYASKVSGLTAPIVDLVAGEGHVVARLANGDVYGCGANGDGQLDDSGDDIDTPIHLNFGSSAAVPRDLAAGHGFTIMLDEADRVWQIGSGSAEPVEIELPDGPIVTQLAAGAAQAAVLRADGALHRWAVADGVVARVELPEGMLANQFALGAEDDLWYVVSTRSGATLAWGYAAGGGNLAGQGLYDTPTPLPVQPFVDITHAYHATIAISPDGKVWSWGRREQRGQGEDVISSTTAPGPVLAPGGQPGTQASAKRFADHNPYNFNGLITQDGRVAVWGVGGPTYLGDGTAGVGARYFPDYVLTEDGEPLSGVRQVALEGTPNNLALLEDGGVMNWGEHPCHRGGRYFDAYATEIAEFGSDNRKIALSAYASYLLKRDGTLLSCGSSMTGHTNNDRRPLREVPGMGPGEVADISTSTTQVLVLKSDGTVWAWEANEAPQQIVMPEGPRIVSVHQMRSGPKYVIREDGSVLGWGGPAHSMGIGDRSSTYIAEPTEIPMPGDAPVYKIDGGFSGYAYNYQLALVGGPLKHLAETVGIGIEASIADQTVTEGEVAGVEVTLNHPAGVDAELTIVTRDDTAIAGVDYEAVTQTITIPAGETSAVVEVPTIRNETTQTDVVRDLDVQILEVSKWMMPGGDTAAVSIIDDDPDPVATVTGPAEVVEGDVGSREIEFTVTLDRPTIIETTLAWRTVDGGAQAPADFAGSTGFVTFEPGETTATVPLQVHGDVLLEPEERFGFELFEPVGLTLGTRHAVEVVISDDEPVLLMANDRTVTAPASGEATMQFTISSPQVLPGETVTVPWSVTAPWQESDPTPAGVSGSGEVILTSGTSVATVEVTVAADERSVPQFFRLALGNSASSANREILATQGLGTVLPAQLAAPTVSIEAPPEVAEGDTVTLSATASGGTGPYSYAWDTDGDGAYDDGAEPSVDVVAATYGEHVFGVQVTDANEQTATAAHTVAVVNVSPTLAPIADQTVLEGTALSVSGSFVDPGQNTWTATVDFGDGPKPLALSGKTFTVARNMPVAGPVTVRVCDDAGGCDEVTFQVAVSDAPPLPQAVITGAAEVDEGSVVTLSASESTGAGPLVFAWDTDGDGAYDDGSGVSIEIPAARHGTLAIALQVTDTNNVVQTSSKKVVVRNVAPEIAPIADQMLAHDAAFKLAGSFNDPGENEWTATVDYGDGEGPQPLTLDGKSFMLSHSSPVSGIVTVRVCDDAEGCGEATFAVTVQEPTPIAAVILGPKNADEGTTATFAATGSSGEGDLEFAWDLDGDGEHDDAVGEHATADFVVPGTRVIGLEVTDSLDRKSTTTHETTVRAVAPVIARMVDVTVAPGESFEVSGSFTDPGENSWTGSVDYGDGPETLGLDGHKFALAHAYGTPGARTVTVTVCDDWQACGSASFTVTVPAPGDSDGGDGPGEPRKRGAGEVSRTGSDGAQGVLLLGALVALAGISMMRIRRRVR